MYDEYSLYALIDSRIDAEVDRSSAEMAVDAGEPTDAILTLVAQAFVQGALPEATLDLLLKVYEGHPEEAELGYLKECL